MSGNQIRRKILEVLWATGKPMSLKEIAQKIGIDASSTMGYLLGLIKAKHVSVPQKHYYAITNLGKQALDLPKFDKKLALSILSSVPLEKAFHFHTGINQYLGVHANSLNDFCDKIQKIDLKSIEFHLPRRDFELWLQSLGDFELAKRIEQIRGMGLSGENLRKKVYEIVKSRCEELVELAK
ncbi:MAG: helix-turn-helix domain-containing protein [Candidatus Bathyarchaeaceae archaeon]